MIYDRNKLIYITQHRCICQKLNGNLWLYFKLYEGVVAYYKSTDKQQSKCLTTEDRSMLMILL